MMSGIVLADFLCCLSGADEKKKHDEKETNKMETRRKAGDPVVFGSVVQLKHRHSAKFVTQSKNRAEHDHLAMEVTLVKDGTEGSWWRVMPAEKVRLLCVTEIPLLTTCWKSISSSGKQARLL